MRTAATCVVGLAQRVAKGQGKDRQGERGRVGGPGQRGVVEARGEGCDRTCVVGRLLAGWRTGRRPVHIGTVDGLISRAERRDFKSTSPFQAEK